jgi:hypothetical protein
VQGLVMNTIYSPQKHINHNLLYADYAWNRTAMLKSACIHNRFMCTLYCFQDVFKCVWNHEIGADTVTDVEVWEQISFCIMTKTEANLQWTLRNNII